MKGIRYAELLSHFRKGVRNGNWRYLSHLEKGLYRAVLFYTRVKGEIVNPKLAAKVLGIVEKLRVTSGLKIFNAGQKEANRILSTYEVSGVNWCPELKDWLENPDYIFWLGLSSSKGRFIQRTRRSLSHYKS